MTQQHTNTHTSVRVTNREVVHVTVKLTLAKLVLGYSIKPATLIIQLALNVQYASLPSKLVNNKKTWHRCCYDVWSRWRLLCWFIKPTTEQLACLVPADQIFLCGSMRNAARVSASLRCISYGRILWLVEIWLNTQVSQKRSKIYPHP